jgi:hypothetical protein
VWRVTTVLVLPSEDPRHASSLGRFLNGAVAATVVVPEPGAGSRSARTCLAINALAPTAPMTIVAFGEAALALPAVALSQRTAHRLVAGYVLIDGDLPAVTESWPDAPVTAVTDDADSPASLQGRLRGWTVVDHADFDGWQPEEQ